MNKGDQRPFADIDLGFFMAGLWSGYLPGNLFWHASCAPGVRISTASQYIAPTWSWASISGSVDWIEPGPIHAELISYAGELIGPCYNPDGLDCTGKRRRVEVVLKARLVPVCLTRYVYELSAASSKRWAIGVQCRDPETGELACMGAYRPDCVEPRSDARFMGGAIIARLYPDFVSIQTDQMDEAEYLAMLLGQKAVIILKRMTGRVFERAGTIHRHLSVDCDDMTRWFANAGPEVVRLV